MEMQVNSRSEGKMADIIVVEDNEEIGELLSDFLQAEGYDTYLADSGEEALEIYERSGRAPTRRLLS